MFQPSFTTYNLGLDDAAAVGALDEDWVGARLAAQLAQSVEADQPPLLGALHGADKGWLQLRQRDKRPRLDGRLHWHRDLKGIQSSNF